MTGQRLDCGADRGSHRWRVALLALVLALLAGIGFRLHGHTGLYGDGPLFVELWRNGVWVHAHFLLLPLARLWTWCAAPLVELGRDEAIRAVSVAAAALTCALVLWWGARSFGIWAALGSTLLLALAPVFRFFAGAVEVHALAGCTAAVAMLLAGRAAGSRAGGLALAASGYALVCATHVSSTLLGPALLLLHLDAERRAGRICGWRRAVASGAILLAIGLLTLGLIALLDRLLIPDAYPGYSAVGKYIEAMQGWDEGIYRPGPGYILLVEILAPLGLISLVALAGIPALLHRRPLLASGWLAAIAAMVLITLKVGAREYGAYMIPALVPLAWFAGHAIARAVRSGSPRPWILLVAAMLLFYLGLATGWGGLPALPHENSKWQIDPADLGLPSALLQGSVAALGFSWTWLGLAAVLALLAGYPYRSGSDPPPRRGAPAIAFAAVLLLCGVSIAAGERFRERWPEHWHWSLRRYCEDARGELAGSDLLVTASVTPEARWTVNLYFGLNWIDLSGLSQDLGPQKLAELLAGLEERMRAARAAGGRVVIDMLVLGGSLFKPEELPRHRAAHAAVLRWLASGLAEDRRKER